MRPYLAQFRAHALLLSQYRLAALSGVVAQFFFGWVRLMVLEAFYAGGRAAPLSLAAACDYIWLSQALFALLPFNLDPDLQDAVRSGEIRNDLLRPVDPLAMWLARNLARRLVPVILRAAPIVIIALVCGLLRPPTSAAALAAIAASLVLAVALSAALTVLVSLSALWTVAGDGMAVVYPPAVWALAGMMVPLPLMPDWAQGALAVLPFRGLIDTPIRLYTGDLAAAACWPHLLHQAGWLVAIVALSRLLINRGLRRLTILGG